MPTIECPSGLKGEIRHLTIKDGRWLTNKQLQRKGKIIDRILQECWISTSDNGIYKFNGAPQWSDVLIGDRDYALIAIRHESWGAYEFKITCPSCEHRFVWDLDLEELLEEQGKTLSKESKEIFANGNRFTVDMELGGKARKVAFKLAIGKDAETAFQEQRKGKRRRDRDRDREENRLLDAAKVRLIDVDGIAPDDLDDYLESLPMKSLQVFIRAFDAKDCGVDTNIEYECPECGAQDEIDLPFDQGFFFPKLRR